MPRAGLPPHVRRHPWSAEERLNTIFDDDELEKFMPNKVKRYFAQNNITVYNINATKIAQKIGLG